MTVEQVAAFLNCHPRTVRRWCEQSKLPQPRKVAGRRLWRSDELLEWFGEQ